MDFLLARSSFGQYLFIGHLPAEAAEQDILDAFSEFGEVCEVKLFRGPDGGSKKACFVKFASREQGAAAIAAANASQVSFSERIRYGVGEAAAFALRASWADSRPQASFSGRLTRMV